MCVQVEICMSLNSKGIYKYVRQQMWLAKENDYINDKIYDRQIEFRMNMYKTLRYHLHIV